MLQDLAKLAIDAIVIALRAEELVAGRARRRRRRRLAAERGVRRRWHTPLDLFEEHVARCCEIGDELRRVHGRKTELDFALELLWGRGCQIGWEILRLLTGGFADGAYARWRTLHELAVVAAFLTKHGDEAAERYFAHAAVKNAKNAREYNECAEKLGYPRMPESEFAEIIAKRDAAIAKYGPMFKGEWGWAATFLPGEPNFEALRRDVGLAHWKAHVGMANHDVHGGPHGVLFQLGHPSGSGPPLVGPSLVGLANPLHASAISLMHLTFDFIMPWLNSKPGAAASETLNALSLTARTKYILELTNRIGESAIACSDHVRLEFGGADEPGRS